MALPWRRDSRAWSIGLCERPNERVRPVSAGNLYSAVCRGIRGEDGSGRGSGAQVRVVPFPGAFAGRGVVSPSERKAIT